MPTLDRALAEGIITREQYDAIQALDASEPARIEAPRGLNWISVAYFAGALIVIFALTWFLADQWEELGALGVLVVASIYAAIFIATSWVLLREGYRVAGGLAAALAVATTPLIVWSLENLGGIWVPWRPPAPFAYHGAQWESGRWTIIQIATIGSALFALRRVSFPFLTVFIAVPAITIAMPLSELIFGGELGRSMAPWMILLFGTALLAVGYVVDGADDRREGFAFWFYLSATAAVVFGIGSLYGDVRWLRHTAPLLAIAAFAASLYLKQRVFLIAGALTLFWYLGYLAFEVFENTALFPVALAAIGLLILLATVQLQRAYPRLVARIEAERGAHPTLPGGIWTALVPLGLAVIVLVARLPVERERARERERMIREFQQRPPRPEAPSRKSASP